MPIVSICGCIFMMIAACFAHRIAVVAYLIVFAVVMIIGAVFANKVYVGSKMKN